MTDTWEELGISETRRRFKWLVPSDAPRTIDDLPFTSRKDDRFKWWDVEPPKTEYWHPHQALGRAYAFELLDLIHNPEREEIPDDTFASIAAEIVRQRPYMDGLYIGFFEVISEYLITGRVDR